VFRWTGWPDASEKDESRVSRRSGLACLLHVLSPPTSSVSIEAMVSNVAFDTMRVIATEGAVLGLLMSSSTVAEDS
jgi:hypothetical protein